jgi:hypothetical protein
MYFTSSVEFRALTGRRLLAGAGDETEWSGLPPKIQKYILRLLDK